MPQRKRTPAHSAAEAKYRAKSKTIRITLREDKEEDIALLSWLRSHVEDDSEIPAFIKQLVEKASAE